LLAFLVNLQSFGTEFDSDSDSSFLGLYVGFMCPSFLWLYAGIMCPSFLYLYAGFLCPSFLWLYAGFMCLSFLWLYANFMCPWFLLIKIQAGQNHQLHLLLQFSLRC
jgi:hypothetical protein